MHHVEDDQPRSTVGSFVAKKPEPLHFESQLWKGLVDSAREPGCGEGKAEVRHKSEGLRTILEARTMGTT